jgi:glycosyltransferase involved in cell wall biosynthesis
VSQPQSQPRSPVKVIAIGYNTSGTGLTRVMESVMRRLADLLEVHFLGIGYQGDVVRDRGLTIHPTNPHGGDVFAVFQAQRMIEEIQPSVLFIMHDIWLFEFYLRHLGPYRDRLKIACYIPLDGRIVNPADAAPLSHADRVITYTQFACTQFEEAFRRLRDSQAVDEVPPVQIIPHGVARDRFHPFPELTTAGFGSPGRARAKAHVFGDRLDPHDSFIVFNGSRPDIRKRIDLTIEGFAKFAADKPANVRLCLHHAIMNTEAEQRVMQSIRQCGIGDRVIFNPLGSRIVDDEELNWLYNACDVGINTSMGEGWGLVSCEHGAAGAAQVVPDHTACGELWRGRAELIPPVRFFVPSITVLEMGEVSPDGVAQALDRLYADPARHAALSRAAADAALDPEFSWDTITRQFAELFISLAQRS